MFCFAAFAQKPPVNAKGKVISIVAIDFPQFQPCKVRVAAEKQAAEAYGVKYTLLQPPATTIDSVIETMTNALTQGYDAIIMEPWSDAPFVEVIALANSKGIPLVNVHVPYADDTKFISLIYIDNTAYGITAADKIASFSGGKANVLIMMNDASISNQATQRQSFIDRYGHHWRQCCQGDGPAGQGEDHRPTFPATGSRRSSAWSLLSQLSSTWRGKATC